MSAPDVRWVPYGRPAAEALRDAVGDAKGGEALAPVTVVVSSNQVGVSTRRLLASGAVGPVGGTGPGLLGVTFATPYRLAELLGAPVLARARRRPVSTPVLTGAVRAALATDPGIFGPVAAHEATEAALVGAYRELRDLDDAALDAVAALGDRARSVVAVSRDARRRLQPHWYDEEDLLDAAAQVVAAGGADHLGAVVVHLPQRLGHHAARLLRAVHDCSGLRVVAGRTGDERADLEVVDSVVRLGGGRPPTGTLGAELGALVDDERTWLLTASDADDEVRAAVRRIVAAVHAGTPLDRIAVLHASAEPYARLVHEHLDAAGLAANGPAHTPVASGVAARTLLGLLDLPLRRFRRQDVMGWYASAPVLDRDRPAPTASWERLSREAGVVAGRDDWDRRLLLHAESLEARAHRIAERGDAEGAVRHHRREAADVRRLHDVVLGLVDDLAARAGEASWAAHAAWAGDLLDHVLGDAAHRAGWPAHEQRAAERVELALDRLAALDQVQDAVALDVFVRTLRVELDADLGRVGRFGDGVLVGPVGLAVGLDLDLLVVVGLAEGSFPASASEDSLLPDGERRASGGALALRAASVDRLHRHLLAALAGARQHLLCIPRGDLRRSSERVASRWALDVASRLTGRRLWSDELHSLDEPWVRHVRSFDDGLRTATLPTSAQEHRLVTLLADGATAATLRDLAGADATLGAGAEALDARRSRAFTRFDGNVAGAGVPSPVEKGVSATSLERWVRCPRHYLYRDLLGVDRLQQPEDSLQMSPVDLGNLVHAALERFILEVLDRPTHAQPGPRDHWSEGDHARLREIGAELCDDFHRRGLTGRRVFWTRQRQVLLDELHRTLLEDDKRRQTRDCRPVAAEMAFGLGGAPDALLALPDGRTLPLRGKADRVDRSEDGRLFVVDYKTGGSRDFRKIGPDDPHLSGSKLQLSIYGVAARHRLGVPGSPVASTYWFVSSRGQWHEFGYEVTDEVLDELRAVAGVVVGGIESGVFLAVPGEHTTSPFEGCPACDPDGLGTGELRRQWSRKATDPALAGYLALRGVDAVDDEAEVAS